MTLLSYVKSDLGLSAYKDSYLMRRLRARMVRKGVETEKDYLNILKKDKKELKALKDSLSINVTSFFRNPEVWDRLKELLREVKDKEIKVWSAACADGREPYSLAIISKQTGIEMKIIATDINNDALQKGREGVFFNIDEELYYLKDANRYFNASDSRYAVKPFLQKNVEFCYHDIINSSPPANDFDLVLCRNFLIYIEPQNKYIVSEHLADSMKKGAILVLGKTETLPIEKKFESVDRVNKIFRRI